jgi:hypothetical protein
MNLFCSNEIRSNVRAGPRLALILWLLLAAPAMAANGGSPAAGSTTIGELSAAWWQWAFSIPTSVNPLGDPEGKLCMVGQHGRVWFLAGTLSGEPADRKCTIPAETRILIPALNGECSAIEGDGGTEAKLRKCVNGLIKGASGTGKVDGKAVKVVRAESPLFSFTLPADNVLGVNTKTKGPNPSPSVAAGLWVFLPPLAPGKHTIHVIGRVGDFTQDVRYTIQVAPPLNPTAAVPIL